VVVLVFIARFLINGLADRLFLTELLEKFYQVNRSTNDGGVNKVRFQDAEV